MSKTVNISSLNQLKQTLQSSKIVVVDFWATWCGPCKMIAPVYEQLSAQLSRPGKVTFTKVDVDSNQDISREYGITSMPTFMVFKSGEKIETVRGADPRQLTDLVRKIAQQVDSDGQAGAAAGSSSGGSGSGEVWLGAALQRPYVDATSQIDLRGLDLLNADDAAGDARTLLQASKPKGLTATAAGGKGKATETASSKDDAAAGGADKKDWVESDTDEQLMLYIPFQSTLKVHTLHITSLARSGADRGEGDDDDDDDAPMRPKTIKIYTNRSNNMGFDEADGVAATQEFSIAPDRWDAATATAKLELRFVKFQNVTSLVVFVVDGDGDGDKTRIDRIRVVGEVGEKREMGKLEKIGEGAE